MKERVVEEKPVRVALSFTVDERTAAAVRDLCEELNVRRGQLLEQVLEAELRRNGWLE